MTRIFIDDSLTLCSTFNWEPKKTDPSYLSGINN